MAANRKRILLADDDEVLCRRLAQALEERGYDVIQVRDGESALEHIVSHRPTYIILDFRLPRRSGLDVLAAMREQNINSEVVLVSGYASIAAAVDAIRLGAVNFLSKPVEVDEVLKNFLAPNDVFAEMTKPVATPSLARVEWEHINRVLADSGNNISETARRLHIHRRSLQRKLQKYPPVD